MAETPTACPSTYIAYSDGAPAIISPEAQKTIVCLPVGNAESPPLKYAENPLADWDAPPGFNNITSSLFAELLYLSVKPESCIGSDHMTEDAVINDNP